MSVQQGGSNMRHFATALSLAAMFLPALGGSASAQQARAERLLGGNENPPVVSEGSGSFRARLEEDRISFRLRYDDVASGASDVTQAHLHIGNPGTNGGIVAWLCGDPAVEPPAGVPDCPASPGELSGDIFEDDVLAVSVTSGTPPVVTVIIEAGDLEGLKRLIEQSSVYANVHTDDHPAGEIRGQMNPRRR
jgi:hypothetical protein